MQPGLRNSVKQECRQLHCCIREWSLYPLFTSANLQEQMSLLHTIWSGPLFFFFNHLIVIHFGKASGVCSASIPCNCVHTNKSAQHCLDKEPGDFVLSVENFLLWTLTQPRLSVTSESEVPSVRLIGIGYVSYVQRDTVNSLPMRPGNAP